jgi:hypothetical protein
MKLDMNKTHNKFIVLLLIAVPILTIGFLFTYWTQIQTDADVVKTQPVLEEPAPKTDSPEVEGPKPEPVPAVTQQDLDASKLVAEKFAQAYANYDASKPLEYVQNAKPYMTKGFYREWENEPPRRPLVLTKSTAVKSETYPIELNDPYAIAWNVVIMQEQINTLDDKVPLEEYFWILLDKEDGGWKVKEVDITNDF